MAAKLQASWTKGLEKDAEIDVRRNYAEALVLRRRLTEILEGKMRSSYLNAHSKEGYDSPNWAYQQADARGYERALHEIIKLIS